MTWARLDDSFPRHPKIWPLSDAAFRLHITAICDSAHYLTDGHIDSQRLPALAPRYKPAHLNELVAAGIWHNHQHDCDTCPPIEQGNYYIHAFLEFNHSRTEVEQRRRQRSEAGRKGGTRSGSTRRSKAEANAKANDQAFASTMYEPRPVPSRPVQLQVDNNYQSSSTTPDDDDTEVTTRAAFAILAQRHLDRRNQETNGRLAPITGTARRNRWLTEDATRTSQLLGVLARGYVDNDPTITPEELADHLDTYAPTETA